MPRLRGGSRIKVVVAFARLHPKTLAAVWDSFQPGDEICWEDTSASDTAYFEAIARHWAAGDGFVILEQDKLPDATALRDLFDCPETWCTYPYEVKGRVFTDYAMLGCTKFSTELLRKYPDLMADVARTEMGFGLGVRHWTRLDFAIDLAIRRRIGKCHWHELGRIGHEHQHAGAVHGQDR